MDIVCKWLFSRKSEIQTNELVKIDLEIKSRTFLIRMDQNYICEVMESYT